MRITLNKKMLIKAKINNTENKCKNIIDKDINTDRNQGKNKSNE